MCGVNRRLLLVIALWTGATLLAFAVARTSKVGPVVMPLFGGHGVHLGDLVALAVAYEHAALISWWLLRRRSQRSGTGYGRHFVAR